MAESPLPHLRITRSEPINERRRKPGFGGGAPSDPAAHANRLRQQLEEEQARAAEIAGFDPRRLVKLTLDGIRPNDLESIPGLTVVAEQGDNATVLFATEAGLKEFQSRLEALASGKKVTRKELLYAIK